MNRMIKRLLAAVLISSMLLGSNGISYAAEIADGDSIAGTEEVTQERPSRPMKKALKKSRYRKRQAKGRKQTHRLLRKQARKLLRKKIQQRKKRFLRLLLKRKLLNRKMRMRQ